MWSGHSQRHMQRRTLSACCLVVLVVASTVAVAVPAAASATTQPSTAPADETADATTQLNRTFEGTAFLAVDGASDGDTVAGGIEVDANASNRPALADATATLVRVAGNGTVEWSTSIAGENATRVVDVLAADDGVYFLVTERTPDATGSQSVDLRLGKATGGGEVRWQQSLNGSVGFGLGTGASLVDTDDGVALAQQVPDRGVRLAEYSGGTVAWERTYGVEGRVASVRATDDGFLLAGSVGFDEPWVLRTTESGRPTFNETYPGIESTGVLGAVPTDDGGALLAGRYRAGFDTGTAAWTARLDGDGGVEWTRAHGAGSDRQFTRVFDTETGLLLVGQSVTGPERTDSVRLLGVGADGSQQFDEVVEGVPRVTAVARTGDSLRVAGLEAADPAPGNLTGVLAELPLPSADTEGDATLAADADLASNGTFYRGQNLRVAGSELADTYTLVRLPGEYDDFEPQAVRRVSVGADGTAVVESATLPSGEYVLRMPYGRPVAVEGGQVRGPADREEAAFRLEAQRFVRVETNRTFVDPAAGQSRVSLAFDSERSDYAVHVRADRFRGDAAGADELRAAFGGVDGFEGVDVVDGQPAARIAVDDQRVRLNATVGAFDPGLYDVVVSGADTRDGGAVADGRIVVGTTEQRPLGLEFANRSLSVTGGEEVETNVTLTGLSEGAGALALSATRTGEPDVRLRLRAEVDASRVSGGGSISPRESTTETTVLDADTSTGAVEVAKLRVRAEGLGREPVTNGTNTATVRVDWAVDEDGLPYTLPEPVTVTYEVTGAGNTTDDGGPGAGGGAGSGGGAVGGEGSEAVSGEGGGSVPGDSG